MPSDRADLPAKDYVSPNLAVVRPDAAFPFMAVGDPRGHPWPYLRKDVPHNWYHDTRHPLVGFASRDEASILFNSARAMAELLLAKTREHRSTDSQSGISGTRVPPALEIGCWRGWSACHLALGGVDLDVIDPVLKKPDFLESVTQSLRAAGVTTPVRLHAAKSPEKVHELAAGGKRWNLIFIDGNHETPGPRDDAEACAHYAADDALVLFHDLAAPDVAAGLDYFRDSGWNTRVYMTAQIMGVAWRGRATPVEHTPDPAVAWSVPGHLAGYAISGWPHAAAV